MNELQKVGVKALASSESKSSTAGVALFSVGSTAIALSLLASLIPFVGVLGLGVILVLLGTFLWMV